MIYSDEHPCVEMQIDRLTSFFFSSRRRHTRLQGDWSSDVCSSDLAWRAPSIVTWAPGGSVDTLINAVAPAAGLVAAGAGADTAGFDTAGAGGGTLEIGRASCRERV